MSSYEIHVEMTDDGNFYPTKPALSGEISSSFSSPPYTFTFAAATNSASDPSDLTFNGVSAGSSLLVLVAVAPPGSSPVTSLAPGATTGDLYRSGTISLPPDGAGQPWRILDTVTLPAVPQLFSDLNALIAKTPFPLISIPSTVVAGVVGATAGTIIPQNAAITSVNLSAPTPPGILLNVTGTLTSTEGFVFTEVNKFTLTAVLTLAPSHDAVNLVRIFGLSAASPTFKCTGIPDPIASALAPFLASNVIQPNLEPLLNAQVQSAVTGVLANALGQQLGVNTTINALSGATVTSTGLSLSLAASTLFGDALVALPLPPPSAPAMTVTVTPSPKYGTSASYVVSVKDPSGNPIDLASVSIALGTTTFFRGQTDNNGNTISFTTDFTEGYKVVTGPKGTSHGVTTPPTLAVSKQGFATYIHPLS